MTANARAFDLRSNLSALVGEFKDLQLAIWAALPDAADPAFDRYVEASGQADSAACALARVYDALPDLFTDAARDDKDQSYRLAPGDPAPAGFAPRLAALRESAGLSLADLGDAAGLSRQRVHQLEAGTHRPSWAEVQALAAALDVSTEVFRDPA